MSIIDEVRVKLQMIKRNRNNKKNDVEAATMNVVMVKNMANQVETRKLNDHEICILCE